MKYCVATCHQGTDLGVFLAGPGDEQLSLEKAKDLANSHGRGHYVFDCTVDEYWAQEDEEGQS